MKEPVYPIGVVSRMLGVHPRMLRIYEKEGLVRPARIGGKRYYSESDLQRLRCIRILLQEGVNIAGIKRLFSLAPCWRVLRCPGKKRQECPYYRAYGRWKMRIAFATESPGGLEARVFAHFGRAPCFTVVELDGEGEIVGVEVLENPFAEVKGPGLVPGFVKEQGVDVIVAGGMGQRAASFFRAAGIEPVAGAEGRVVDVLSALIAGERFEGEFCAHHDHEGCKGGDSHEGVCDRRGSGA